MRQFSVLPPGALAACLALQPAPRSLTDPWRAAHIQFGTPPRGVPVQCLCTSQVRVRLKRPVPGLRGRPGADLSDTSRALWREQVRNAQFAGPPAGRIHLWPTGGKDMPRLPKPVAARCPPQLGPVCAPQPAHLYSPVSFPRLSVTPPRIAPTRAPSGARGRMASSGNFPTSEVFPDLHHKMSKKIAQLAKVVYALNTRNEEHEGQMKAMSKRYDDELQTVMKDAAAKVSNFQDMLKDRRAQAGSQRKMEQAMKQVDEEREEAQRDAAALRKRAEDAEARARKEVSAKVASMRKELEAAKEQFSDRARQFAQVRPRPDLHTHTYMAHPPFGAPRSLRPWRIAPRRRLRRWSRCGMRTRRSSTGWSASTTRSTTTC